MTIGAPRAGEPRMAASCRKPDAKGSGGHGVCPGKWASNRRVNGMNIRHTGDCPCECHKEK